MKSIFKERDIKIYNRLTEYLKNNENPDLETELDNINTAVANGIYPYTYLYNVEKELDRIEQIRRIKELDRTIKAIEESSIALNDKIEEKRGSLKK